MKKTVYIMRGLQGSGKSTLAKKIASKLPSVICSADDYFMKDGEYEWKAEEMKEAHEYCFDKFKTAIEQNVFTIVIDNTNIKLAHFISYINHTLKINSRHFSPSSDYKIKIMEPRTWWKLNARELYKRNTHKVPIKTIEKNIRNWDNIIYLCTNKVLCEYKIWKPKKLPRGLCTLWQRIMNVLN